MLLQLNNNKFDVYLSIAKAYRKWGYFAGLKNNEQLLRTNRNNNNLLNPIDNKERKTTIISKEIQGVLGF